MSVPHRNSPGKPMIGSPTKRREMDLMKLYVLSIEFSSLRKKMVTFRMLSDYEVTTCGDSCCEFWVKFHGPKDSVPCEG